MPCSFYPHLPVAKKKKKKNTSEFCVWNYESRDNELGIVIQAMDCVSTADRSKRFPIVETGFGANPAYYSMGTTHKGSDLKLATHLHLMPGYE
jgi:hypothetical protein